MKDNELLIILSVLLQYPDNELIEFCKNEQISDIDDPNILNSINYFLDYINNKSLEELQKYYVQTFDFDEDINLYLSYSKDIDDKERGGKLLQLKKFYRDSGFLIDTDELPDYYPLMLEFMSIVNMNTTKELFSHYLEEINNLKIKLNKINSPYEKLIDASITIIVN